MVWQGFPGGSGVKNLPADVRDTGDVGAIPGSGRFPGGGNSNPLQYFCLENPVARGIWQPLSTGSQSWIRHDDWAHAQCDRSYHFHSGLACGTQRWAHAHLVKQLQKRRATFISQNTHMNMRGLSNTGHVLISIDKWNLISAVLNFTILKHFTWIQTNHGLF